MASGGLRAFLVLLGCFLTAAWLSPSARAQEADTSSGRLERRAADAVAVLQREQPPQEVFSDSFLNALPAAQLLAMADQMAAEMGPLLGLERVEAGAQPGLATIALRFEQAIASGPMQLEAQEPYRIASLRIDRIEPTGDDQRPLPEQIAELPGIANLLFTRLDGSPPLLEHAADTPLAIGSTFKLYVLSALVQEIAAGRRAWDEVVALDTHSFPSGILQDWPLGTPLTLQSLATLMISMSDNTATDQLIHTLGREVVEGELAASGHSAPELNQPFLTTRELFLLKAADEEDVNLGEFASLGTPERLAALLALQDRDVARERVAGAFTGEPRAIDVEWFASPRDIVRIFDRLKDDPVATQILSVNKGLDAGAIGGWNYVGFKGGSEPGVLNLSWLLRDEAGAWHVLTAGWNNPEETVPAARLLGLARQALAGGRPAGH